MWCSLYSFEGTFDDVLSCLCQYLDSHVIRDHVFLDQGTHELVLCLRCCRESDFDLFESHIDQ